MVYRKLGKTGLQVSALGLGCMRFPDGKDGKVDEKYGIKMIHEAIEGGINYFDSGWPYHDGLSEVVLGKALKDGRREKVIVATKCPMSQMNSPEDFERVFNIQLERLQLENLDSYMFHGLDREDFDDKVIKFGLIEKMEKLRSEGRIKYMGFSFHDSYDSFMYMLNYFNWDFCQVQMNYIDIEYQATLKGVREAGQRGIGVIAMEPLLGGKLANLSEIPKSLVDSERSPVEWALDFLWNEPAISVVLSGMSTYEQQQQNIEYASRSGIGMLSEEQVNMLMRVRDAYNNLIMAPCTRCKYCMPCPVGIDIPRALKAYNSTATGTMEDALAYYNRQVNPGAGTCIGCKNCEGLCPQHIEISELMKKIASIFGR